MNERRFKDYLMVMLVSANGYGSTNALIKACEAANAIPESEWNRRKAALNAIAEKAPLRQSEYLTVLHADIPKFMQEQWENFSAFQHLTRRNYRFEHLVAPATPSPNQSAVAAHVLKMQENYGFTCDLNNVEEAVRSSTGVLGMTLSKQDIQAACAQVLERQDELENGLESPEDEKESFGLSM